MKVLHRDQEDAFNDVDLTPLIDMVFILLIFFIISSSFIKDAGIVVDRPSAATGKAQSAHVVVAIDGDNVLWMEGASIDIRSLKARMGQLLTEREDLGVLVAADTRTNAGLLVKVLDLCRQAGVDNVSVATREEGA